MIKLTRKAATGSAVETTLTLPLHSRTKSRLRVSLDNGEAAGLFLERGSTLKDGDLLESEHGYRVRVVAAPERVSVIRSEDPHLLMRACYHLGNRHVSIQIETKRISYLHDHVLDEMLRGFGLTVESTEAPFEPEAGAYGGSAHQGHHHHSHGIGEADDHQH